MKNLINSFLTIILLLAFTFTGISLFTITMQKRNAEVFHDKIINEIASSDFSSVVINQAIAEGSTYGYQVSVIPLKIVDNKRIYSVKMNYVLNLPIFGVEKSGQLDGYAR